AEWSPVSPFGSATLKIWRELRCKTNPHFCKDAMCGNEATMPNCKNEPADEPVWLDDAESGRADPPSERVLSIENVAKMFGVSKLSLRYYELRGLIRRTHSLD